MKKKTFLSVFGWMGPGCFLLEPTKKFSPQNGKKTEGRKWDCLMDKNAHVQFLSSSSFFFFFFFLVLGMLPLPFLFLFFFSFLSSGNHFHPFPHVWLSRKISFSGKWLPVDQYFHLWPGNHFLPSFSLQITSGKREREREPRLEREREKREPRSRRLSDDRTAPTSGAVHDRDRRTIASLVDRRAVRVRRARSSIDERRDRDRRSRRSSDKRFAGFDAFSGKMFKWTKHQN